MSAQQQPAPVGMPPGKEWAFRMVANAGAGFYVSRSALPLKWVREVVTQYSQPSQA